MSNIWMVKCPYCDKVHDASESIECGCGAHGHRQGIGWVWIASPSAQNSVQADEAHCNCFPKYAHKKDGVFVCDNCGKPLRR